ncbi:MAG: hypothetical protein AB8I08_32580 [Sandaracinaceae bacterium]
MPELVCILFVPLVVVAAILWSMLGGVMEARDARRRWGSKQVTLTARGEGAYREGELSSRVPRSMPALVAWTGVSGLGLSMLTGLVFAPMGLLFSALMLGPYAVQQPFGGALFLGALSGLSLSVVLHGSCRSLLRSERDAGNRAKRVAVYSFVHHAGLTAVFLLGSMYRPFDMALAAAPAMVGALHASMLYAAGSRAALAHQTMSADEKDELPVLGG